MASHDDPHKQISNFNSNSSAHPHKETDHPQESEAQLHTPEDIIQSPESQPVIQETNPPPEQLEQVENVETFASEPVKEEDKSLESRTLDFTSPDGQSLDVEKDKSSLMLATDEMKLDLGDFRSLALTDIDGSLHLPMEEELKQLVQRSQVGKGDRAREEEEDNAVVQRGRLRIQNVGGSLTILLQIALLAWGIRQLRSVLAKRRQKQAPRINTVPFRPCDTPLFSTLSALAVKKLVEINPTSHLLIDVRFSEALQASSFPLKNTVNIPEADIRIVFQLSEAEWSSRFPYVKSPEKSQLLVFLSTKGSRAQRAAHIAADLGYNGCCVLSGGIPALHALGRDGEQFQPTFLSRDAVAALLQNLKYNTGSNATSPKLFLIDVRRHDERALYGHIFGSTHVPVNEWPKALVMEPSEWERNYGCPKYRKEDLVILYCRTNNRSSWGAQVAYDAGLNRCFVLKGGVLGWHLDANVLPYDGYALGNPPPEPHRFEVEAVNYEAAEQELQQLELCEPS